MLKTAGQAPPRGTGTCGASPLHPAQLPYTAGFTKALPITTSRPALTSVILYHISSFLIACAHLNWCGTIDLLIFAQLIEYYLPQLMLMLPGVTRKHGTGVIAWNTLSGYVADRHPRP